MRQIMRQDTCWQSAFPTLQRRFDMNVSLQEQKENAECTSRMAVLILGKLIAWYLV